MTRSVCELVEEQIWFADLLQSKLESLQPLKRQLVELLVARDKGDPAAAAAGAAARAGRQLAREQIARAEADPAYAAAMMQWRASVHAAGIARAEADPAYAAAMMQWRASVHAAGIVNGPSIVLGEQGDQPRVNGVVKKRLTVPQYNVVKALLEARERIEHSCELIDRSRYGDAVKILKRLARDSDWQSVIQLAGSSYGRYRILR